MGTAWTVRAMGRNIEIRGPPTPSPCHDGTVMVAVGIIRIATGRSECLCIGHVSVQGGWIVQHQTFQCHRNMFNDVIRHELVFDGTKHGGKATALAQMWTVL